MSARRGMKKVKRKKTRRKIGDPQNGSGERSTKIRGLVRKTPVLPEEEFTKGSTDYTSNQTETT